MTKDRTSGGNIHGKIIANPVPQIQANDSSFRSAAVLNYSYPVVLLLVSVPVFIGAVALIYWATGGHNEEIEELEQRAEN